MKLQNKYFKIVITFLVSLPVFGCSDCDFESVDKLENGDWTAELEYRKCGSYSGFGVLVYRSNDGKPGYGQSDKEPFLAGIRSSKAYVFKKPPISMKWVSNDTLQIEHDTRNSIDDANDKLKVFKADKKIKEINIRYIPNPVIWE